jgi:hypothetical protein
MNFDSVQVFSATMPRERAVLGEIVTAWIAQHGVDVVDIVITQSSDASFHCLSICVFSSRPRR